MGYETWIAHRYLWSKRKHPFVRVTSAVSLVGIAVGVAALIAVLAVMNGFDSDLRDRIIGFRAPLVLEKLTPFNGYAPLARQLEANAGITGVAPYIEGQALLKNEELAGGILVRGVDPAAENKVSRLSRYMSQGTLGSRPDGIVLGEVLARKLNLAAGSEVRLLSQASKKPVKLVVEGLFASGMYDYDANVALVSLSSAQTLFEMPGAVTGLSIALDNPEDAELMKQAIQKKLQAPYVARTWMDTNRTLFGALKLEKAVMFLILGLIIFVACLNIAGSLTLLVIDKTRDIGVLKALGATSSSLLKIFALDGLWLGLSGALAGLGLGGAICFVLSHWRVVELPKEIYYLDRLPVRVELGDTLMIVTLAVALAWLAALYPARVASRLDPVKALRYD